MQRLPPFYYLDNFACLLRLLRERDHDLLLPAEHAFMQEFFDLPHDAQALTARVAARSVAVMPESSLCYSELSDTTHALATLAARGWLRVDPVVAMEDLFRSLPLSTLAAGFGLNPRRALNKTQMLTQARELYPTAAALSQTHFRIREALYQFVHGDLCHRLCAQYFGTPGYDWSRYVLRDLGIRRYECVPFDAHSRPFRTQAEVQCFHQLEVCRQRLEADSDPAATIEALLPEPPSACEWLLARYQNTAYRVAQRFERDGDLVSALARYRGIESPEAGARAGVVSRRQRGERPTPRPIKRLVPHFDSRSLAPRRTASSGGWPMNCNTVSPEATCRWSRIACSMRCSGCCSGACYSSPCGAHFFTRSSRARPTCTVPASAPIGRA